MPTVPTYDLPTVSPTAAPNVQQQNPVNADLLNISNKQVGAAGDALANAGGFIEAHRQRALEQADALRAVDAENQYREQAQRLQYDPKEGFNSQTGFAAVKRDSGLPLADEYAGRLNDARSNIEGTLSSDRQRQMFRMRAGGITSSFFGSAMAHESKQYTDYTVSTLEAKAKLSGNEIALNPLDEDNVQSNVTSMRAGIQGGMDADGKFIPGAAQYAGKSATWAKEKADEAVSGSMTLAVKGLLDKGDVNGAAAFRKKYSDHFLPADMLQIDGTLKHNYDMQLGAVAASRVMASAQTALQPNDADRFVNLVMGAESGGRQYGKDGQLLEGPPTKYGTAKGNMQVLDSTMMNPGLGLPNLPADATPEQRTEQGKKYAVALLKRYDGNTTKAAAAYNWGFANVDKAIKANPDGWLADAPPETQKYASGITQKYGAPGGGAPVRPTLDDLHQQVRADLGPNAPPVALQNATAAVTQRFQDQSAAINQRADEALAAVQKELIPNGGKMDMVTPSKLAALAQQAPGKYDDAVKFAKALGKPDMETNMAAFNQAMTYPEELAKLSDSQFLQFQTTNFTKADGEKVAKMRAGVINGDADLSAGSINHKALTSAIALRLEAIGINPTPKPTDLAGKTRVGTVQKFAADAIYDQQKQLGRKMTPQEVSDQVDNLFAKNVAFKSAFSFLGASDNVKPLLGTQISDIPSAARDALKASFKARGQPNPSDSDLLGAYFRWKKNDG